MIADPLPQAGSNLTSTIQFSMFLPLGLTGSLKGTYNNREYRRKNEHPVGVGKEAKQVVTLRSQEGEQ